MANNLNRRATIYPRQTLRIPLPGEPVSRPKPQPVPVADPMPKVDMKPMLASLVPVALPKAEPKPQTKRQPERQPERRPERKKSPTNESAKGKSTDLIIPKPEPIIINPESYSHFLFGTAGEFSNEPNELGRLKRQNDRYDIDTAFDLDDRDLGLRLFCRLLFRRLVEIDHLDRSHTAGIAATRGICGEPVSAP